MFWICNFFSLAKSFVRANFFKAKGKVLIFDFNCLSLREMPPKIKTWVVVWKLIRFKLFKIDLGNFLINFLKTRSKFVTWIVYCSGQCTCSNFLSEWLYENCSNYIGNLICWVLHTTTYIKIAFSNLYLIKIPNSVFAKFLRRCLSCVAIRNNLFWCD